MQARTLASAVVGLAVVLGLSGSAVAGLVNYYSFNSQTLLDEASSYSQNVGKNRTDLTISDTVSGGTIGTNFVPGVGTNYDPSVTGDYAIYIKGAHVTYRPPEALVFPGGNTDVDLTGNGTHGWTLEFWVHTGDYGNYGGNTYVSFMSGSIGMSFCDYTFSSYIQPTEPTIVVNDMAVTQSGGWVSGRGLWHHVAVVCYGDGAWDYYYDGEVCVRQGAPANLVPIASLQFGLDTASALGARYWHNSIDAYIDDIAMWDVPLDATVVSLHANKQLGLTVPEPATLSLLALGGLAVLRRRR